MNQRGFTLVETLVAFAILAVMLVAIYAGLGTSINGIDRASRWDTALLLAQSKLDALAALKDLQSPLSGTDADTAIAWKVEAIASDKPESDDMRLSPLRLQRVRLTMSWQEGARMRSFAIERTLLLRRAEGAS